MSTEALRGAEILFRRLDAPVASWSVPGIRWVVEFWAADMAYPIGQAWVMAADGLTYLDWLHVQEEYRRERVATRLLDAARERWPHLLYDGATDAGEAFVAVYDAAAA